MEDINKDLKILEGIKDMFIHLKNYGYINDIKKDIDTDKAIQAIESTINRYKELKEENQQLEAIKDEAIRRYNFESIPVSLVEEKIAELKEEIEQLRIERNVTYDSGIYRNQIKIDILQELLEKRK